MSGTTSHSTVRGVKADGALMLSDLNSNTLGFFSSKDRNPLHPGYFIRTKRESV